MTVTPLAVAILSLVGACNPSRRVRTSRRAVAVTVAPSTPVRGFLSRVDEPVTSYRALRRRRGAQGTLRSTAGFEQPEAPMLGELEGVDVLRQRCERSDGLLSIATRKRPSQATTRSAGKRAVYSRRANNRLGPSVSIVQRSAAVGHGVTVRPRERPADREERCVAARRLLRLPSSGGAAGHRPRRDLTLARVTRPGANQAAMSFRAGSAALARFRTGRRRCCCSVARGARPSP